MSFLNKIDTRKEAYKLIHDPTRLLCLLYSKYGDIDEDYFSLKSNQLIYNRPSHLNAIYKESQYLNSDDEYLKRYYHKYETIQRIPKLSDYYKNYYLFFCKPLFRNFYITELMHNYDENKAEIFYKNNYSCEKDKKEQNNNNNKNSESSSLLTSLDNITDIKNIFNHRNKKIIDNNLNPNTCTVTLNSESLKNKSNFNSGFISKRSSFESFEKIVKNIVEYKKSKTKKKKKKFLGNKKHNLVQSNNNIGTNFFSLVKNKIKNSTYSLLDKTKNNKKVIFFSAKTAKQFASKISSRLDNNKNIYSSVGHKRNKTYSQSNNHIISTNNNNVSNRNNNINNINNNMMNIKYSNFKNFSKLSAALKQNKINMLNNNTNYNNLSLSNNINNSFRTNFNNGNFNKSLKSINIINNKYQKNNTFDYHLLKNKYRTQNKSGPKIINLMNYPSYKKNRYGGSKFNLVKNSIIEVIKGGNSNLNGKKFNNFHVFSLCNNSRKKALISNPSGSIRKYNSLSSKGDNKKKNFSVVKTNRCINKCIKNNVSYTNNNFNINFNNVIFYSQLSSSIAPDTNNINSTINNNGNTNPIRLNKKVNNNLYINNLKNIYNFSRNKNKIQSGSLTQNQTNNYITVMSGNNNSKNKYNAKYYKKIDYSKNNADKFLQNFGSNNKKLSQIRKMLERNHGKKDFRNNMLGIKIDGLKRKKRKNNSNNICFSKEKLPKKSFELVIENSCKKNSKSFKKDRKMYSHKNIYSSLMSIRGKFNYNKNYNTNFKNETKRLSHFKNSNY